MNATLLACYTLSGAAALALEMLWMRSAALRTGATAATTATVLACYFAGLALGSALGARGVRRPVRRYGLLELATAGAAIWSVLVLDALGRDGAQRWLARWPAAAPVALALAIIPATTCMGATLPAIGQALVARGTLARRGGLVYAANTVGGAAGIAAAGFGLPAAIGVLASYAVAIAASACAGLVALVLGDRAASTPGSPRAATAPDDEIPHADDSRGGGVRDAHAGSRLDARSRARLRLLAAATGALGLALEVLWTRLYAQVLHNSVYSFSAVAIVFVAALALGAAAASILLRRLPPFDVVGLAAALGGVTTLAGFWLFVWWTDGLGYVGMRTGLGEYVARIVGLAAATAGPAAFASGMILPALWAAWGEGRGVARPLASLTAANLGGAIAGALVVGFVAVPAVGMRATLLLVTIAYLALAAGLPTTRLGLRPIVLAALLLVALADPLRAPIVHLRSAQESPRAVLEGAAGTVSVVDDEGDRQLRLDNFYVLGGTAAATNERRLGLVPLLLHPDPQRVAFIGLATGITASAAPALGVADTTVVELVPEVATAARTHFARWNGSVLEQPSVRLVVDDGRRHLQAVDAHYDVIVSDLFVPWHAGTTSLYAREMYATVARRLAPDGVFCQWLPLYQLTRDELDVIVHTFLSVFPEAQLWRADFYPNRPVVGLVGRLAPAPVDLDRIGRRIARLPSWSRDPLLASPLGLAMLYAGDLHRLDDVFAAAPLNTDDRPRIEFLAPRLTRISAAGDKDWFTGDALADFYDTLATRDAESAPFVPASASARDAQRAGRTLYRYALAAARHDAAAARLEDEVRRLAPEVVAAADVDVPDQDLADARRGLDELRDQQADVLRQLDAIEHRLETLGTPEEQAR